MKHHLNLTDPMIECLIEYEPTVNTDGGVPEQHKGKVIAHNDITLIELIYKYEDGSATIINLDPHDIAAITGTMLRITSERIVLKP